MLDIGGWEFLVVAFVLIMVVGPKELPRMLSSFKQFSRSMRKMAREFTDGMNQIANDAEVAELKKAMNEAKGGDLDKLASAIDPGGDVGESVRDLTDSMDKDTAAEDIKEIGNMAGKAGQDIAEYTQIKVGFFTALCISFPILSIQIWKFIAPALYKNEKQAFLPFLIATPVLFAMGAAMVYYIVTPLAWNFFIGFEMAGSEGSLAIEIEPRISEYLSLIMRLIFAFGLAFELPVVLLLLVRAGLATPEGLAQKRKFAIVIAFVAAAILTPPDVVSQLLLALPIIALYELSIFGAKILAPEPYDESAN